MFIDDEDAAVEEEDADFDQEDRRAVEAVDYIGPLHARFRFERRASSRRSVLTSST